MDISGTINTDLEGLPEGLKFLYADGCGIDSFEWITRYPEIEVLSVSNNEITDVKPLAQCSSLRRLLLGSNPISDLSPLATLTGLEELDAGRTIGVNGPPAGNSLEFLRSLQSLVRLDLDYNGLGDLHLAPLSSMKGLIFLNLTGNRIQCLAPLAGLKNLLVLLLGENNISSVEPLEGLLSLVRLILRNNQVTDPLPLGGLSKLSTLNLEENRVSTFSPLLEKLEIEHLWEFYYAGNPLAQAEEEKMKHEYRYDDRLDWLLYQAPEEKVEEPDWFKGLTQAIEADMEEK